MVPLPPSPIPRLITYHQTHFHPSSSSTPPSSPSSNHISLLPLLTNNTQITHVILAALHLNDPPGHITLNNDPPTSPIYTRLWEEVDTLQFTGVRVLIMLGGAAAGSFHRLDDPDDDDPATFEQHYLPLRNLLRAHRLDGIDLDVEEEMSLSGIIRLIDRLDADFGPGFLITLAPVATALCRGEHLSGFDYEALEVLRGRRIAWYNVQFYCGWGDLRSTAQLDGIVACGWPLEKVVVGVVTNPGNGSGWVDHEVLRRTIGALRARYGVFGGVMGWEYFNGVGDEMAVEEGEERGPWEWAKTIARTIGRI